VPFGLPGASGNEARLSVHRGGDLPESSPSVRAITGLAHHAWLGAWAGLVGRVAAPAGATALGRAGAMLGALVALLLVRAALAHALPARRVELAPR
jgi:hypothetical protein